MRILLVLFCVFTCWSCANLASPNGGVKDETPPRLVKSTPPMRTIYFDYAGFELEFDEIIDLDNINGQLIISPPMKEKPDVRYRRKKISLSFDKDDLLENTTYSFNFGNAIVDHNEKNILKNFSYVFSTGSYIDSLTVSGKVYDSFTKETVENITVLLYRNLEDSMPLTSLPNYFDISDENGNYTINNIKEGTYKVFAIEDMNQNYLYDLPTEKIGFLDEFIILDSSLTDIDLNVFNEKNEMQYVSDRNFEPYGKGMITFNKPVENLEITLVDEVFEKEEYEHQLSKGKDTLNIWFPDYEDSFLLILNEDTSFIDTTDIELVPIYSLESTPILTITSNLKDKVDVNKKVDLNKTLELYFDSPIISWNPSFITLHEDSLKVEIEPYFADSLKLTLKIPYKWKENKRYVLIVGLGSFVNFYNSNNELLELKFGSQEEGYYGKIFLNIDLGEAKTPFLIQLLDKEKKIVKEELINESGLVSYDYLRPGEYNFRLIQDLNNNGEWDTGNYDDKTQPEPVVYYPGPTNVRSNWDVELTWEINLIDN